MKRELNLENFYVYEGNKIAMLAIKKIIEFPGELFNPFYVYSGPGLGKSHLLWALHGELNKRTKTLFFPIKDFEQYLEKTKVFDTPLIVDDLQSLDIRFGELLLGIIDSFIATNRQICFSGNAAPRELAKFDSRLWSRLEGGLVCDIASPKEIALVELIRNKSDEQGILLPDEVALEIAQISSGSIRTIEGMINRLIAYSSLGNVSLDSTNVRMILKDFYPKGMYSPVSSLLEELKKNASEVLQQVAESVDERAEYREKVYIWEMKGFDTSSLKPMIDGDVNHLKKEYDIFIKKVERLVELQKEYGSLDVRDHPDEAMQIESMLFSPDRAEEIASIISELRGKAPIEEPGDPFAGFQIGAHNENAVRIYREQVTADMGNKFNPFVIYGPSGSGKTTFLRAISGDLKARGKRVVFIEQPGVDQLQKDLNEYDAVIIDSVEQGFNASYDLKIDMIEFFAGLLRAGKFLILGSAPLSGEDMPEQYRQLFDLGLEVRLEPLPAEPSGRAAEAAAEPELVPLGLPGESERSEALAPPKSSVEPEPKTDEVRNDVDTTIKEPLKKIHDERLIIEEIKGELIEENF